MVYICFSIVAVSHFDGSLSLSLQETAHEKTQKYKEGKSVLERSVDIWRKKNTNSSFCFFVVLGGKIIVVELVFSCRYKVSGPDGSNYWHSHGAHIGGSDADDA